MPPAAVAVAAVAPPRSRSARPSFLCRSDSFDSIDEELHPRPHAAVSHAPAVTSRPPAHASAPAHQQRQHAHHHHNQSYNQTHKQQPEMCGAVVPYAPPPQRQEQQRGVAELAPSRFADVADAAPGDPRRSGASSSAVVPYGASTPPRRAPLKRLLPRRASQPSVNAYSQTYSHAHVDLGGAELARRRASLSARPRAGRPSMDGAPVRQSADCVTLRGAARAGSRARAGAGSGANAGSSGVRQLQASRLRLRESLQSMLATGRA